MCYKTGQNVASCNAFPTAVNTKLRDQRRGEKEVPTSVKLPKDRNRPMQCSVRMIGGYKLYQVDSRQLLLGIINLLSSKGSWRWRSIKT